MGTTLRRTLVLAALVVRLVAPGVPPALAGPFCQTTVPIAVPTGLPALDVALTDGDGLDDQAEDELAACAMPVYHFDSDENARQAFEPVMLHAVYPDGFAAGGFPRIAVKFAELYAKDGGFIYCATPEANWCNEHVGDTQAQHLTLLEKVVRAASSLTLFLDGSGSSCRYAATPGGADGDGDGIPDKCDACPDLANPDQSFPYEDEDVDADGIADTAATTASSSPTPTRPTTTTTSGVTPAISTTTMTPAMTISTTTTGTTST